MDNVHNREVQVSEVIITRSAFRRYKVKKRLKTTLAVAAIIVPVSLVGAGAAYYSELESSIQTADVRDLVNFDEDAVGTNQDDAGGNEEMDQIDTPDGSSTYMIVGIDEDEDGFERSDALVLAHLPEDRSYLDIVSIPRDSMVTIPDCQTSDGDIVDGQSSAMINSAFAVGNSVDESVACTQRTIEENANVTVDGFAVVDFQGFENVVDALGGIEIELEEDLASDTFNAEEGVHVLDGAEALDFARVRKLDEGGEGTGSDLERVERQQQLMSAIIDEALASYRNPIDAHNMASAVLDMTTVSEDLGSIPSVLGLAESIDDIPEDSINFHTVPNEPWANDPNRVVWTDEADSYWEAMNDDEPVDE